MLQIFKKLVLFFFICSFCNSIIHSQATAEECKLAAKYKVLDSVVASSGNWANLRNNPGSARFESDRLLKQGYILLTSVDSSRKIPALILESSPKKYLSEYNDFDYCKNKFSSTSQNPIKFVGLTFANIEDLSKWFSDFSQGSGKEGKELYAICDKSCSPQYTLEIREKSGKLDVDANVVCGHARDKDDGMYLMCTGA